MDNYNHYQKEEIRWGIEYGLDTSIYADPKFSWEQMSQIRLGLEEGLKADIYADPRFNDNQMQQIRYGLQAGIDVGAYADPNISWQEMAQIRCGLLWRSFEHANADSCFIPGQSGELCKGVETTPRGGIRINHNVYDQDQANVIRYGLEDGIDIRIYADPKITEEQMGQILNKIRQDREEGICIDNYFDPRYDAEQIDRIRSGPSEEMAAQEALICDIYNSKGLREAINSSPELKEVLFNGKENIDLSDIKQIIRSFSPERIEELTHLASNYTKQEERSKKTRESQDIGYGD